MADTVQNINLGSVQSPYLEQILILPANSIQKFDYVHNCFNLLDSSGVLNLTFGGAAVETEFTAGMYYQLDSTVPYVTFYNRTNAPLTIHFALGVGSIKDNRLNISGTVVVSEKPKNALAVTNHTIVDGSTTLELTGLSVMQNNGANNMYIGAADGLLLAPNGTFDVDIDGNVTVYGTDGDKLTVGSFS